MRALGIVREMRMQRHKEADAAPNRRDAYKTQKQQVSYTEIIQLSAEQAVPVQNADGSFPFLAGFDRF